MRKTSGVFIIVSRSIFTCAAWIISISYLLMTLSEDYFTKSYLFLAFIGLITLVVIFTWQKYNYQKFGKMDRRKFPQPVTTDRMGEIFAVTGKTVEEFRSSNSLSLELVREYDSEGERFVDRLIMLADTIEGEISPPYAERTVTAPTSHEREKVAV